MARVGIEFSPDGKHLLIGVTGEQLESLGLELRQENPIVRAARTGRGGRGNRDVQP